MLKQEKNIILKKDGRSECLYPKEKNSGRTKNEYVTERTFDKVAEKLETIILDNSYFGNPLFESVSLEWLKIQKPQLKMSSYAKYLNLLNSYLIPYFGDFPVQSLTRTEVLRFSRNLLISGGVSKQGLSPKTVNSILSVLKNVFKYVNRERSILTDSIDDISVRQKQKPMRVLSKIEQATLSYQLRKDLSPSNLGILLCLYTGMRIGEICALTWEDINIDEKYLFVHRSMQRVQTGENGVKTKVIIQTPKSECSIRRIPMPDEMLQLLSLVQKPKEAFLLTGMIHKYIEPRSMENRFKKITELCGISNVNFHALRHTFATRCVELGFDIKCLSEILGHASVNITLNRYVHPSMELKQENMNRLSALLTIE